MNQPGEKHITYCCASLDLCDYQSQVNISSFPEIILYFSGPFILLCTFYFLFSPTIPPLQFFLLTNDLALDFTEKIKAERTEICKPAMTSTYPSAAFKPIFSAFPWITFSPTSLISPSPLNHSLYPIGCYHVSNINI